jgi:DNA-binding NtrC family response regulator
MIPGHWLDTDLGRSLGPDPLPGGAEMIATDELDRLPVETGPRRPEHFLHRGARPGSRAIPLDGILLGRGERVFDEPFDDPALSVRHAEVHVQGAEAVVRDLGSRTGTRLNGIALHDAHPLVEGDVLRLGDTMLVFSKEGRFPVARADRADAELQLTGATPSIEAVRRSIEAVAAHPRTVVITGETGTGKEIVARLIHRRSGRRGPFVAVNCGGLTESLLASELFGHVRGAFTGAIAEQQGLFRAAHEGTLFLDEAGDLPPAMQATLLRVLETWHVRPVGSSRDVPVDVRVVAASNRELVTMVRQGQFRADLYARLAQWIIRVPALRERREDIPALSRALLSQIGAAGRTLTPDLEEALLVHPWPLNVRGLANVLSIAAIATPAGSPLGLGPEVESALEDNRVEGSVAPSEVVPVELDRPGLEVLLRRFGGRVAEMARHAGVSRPRLYRMLWSAGLDPAPFRAQPAPGSPR